MPPLSKKRKIAERAEEVVFDPEARQDYLTGFHKRKLQRVKHAQEQAAKLERELKIESRKQMREQRKKDLESHVQAVKVMMEKSRRGNGSVSDEDEENHDQSERPETALKEGGADEGREDEYVDEEKYTTVTVEPMNLSDGEDDESGKGEEPSGEQTKAEGHGQKNLNDGSAVSKRAWTKEKPTTSKPKKKRKKFRYETKVERKAERSKVAAKNSAAAKARRGE